MKKHKRGGAASRNFSDYDDWPLEAQRALQDSAWLGIGFPELRVAIAPGPLMAMRIRAADLALRAGDNIGRAEDHTSLKELNDILLGRKDRHLVPLKATDCVFQATVL